MSTNRITVSTANFSNALLSKLAVKPGVFLRMLTSTKSSTEVATTASVSPRTVQRYRKVFRSGTTNSI